MGRFGKYEILSLIGRGGMAEVYKARVEEGPYSGELVALKRLLPAHSNCSVDPEMPKCVGDSLDRGRSKDVSSKHPLVQNQSARNH